MQAKGTVYNYFIDKAALVEAVTQSVEARAAERINRAVGNLSTAGARAAAAICAMFETAARYPEQAVILERRIGAAGGHESLIGRVLLKELRQGEFDCNAEISAQRATLTLILSAICSGMREVTCAHARWGADATQALIARCLVALGIGEERAALERAPHCRDKPLETARFPHSVGGSYESSLFGRALCADRWAFGSRVFLQHDSGAACGAGLPY